jgi:hypothetical protein
VVGLGNQNAAISPGCWKIMKRVYWALLLVLVVMFVAHGASSPESVSGKLIFVDSPDAGRLESQKVTTCLTWLVRELGLEGKDLPVIVVVHVSEKAGKAAGVEATRVRRNSSGGPSNVYYEFWIIGQGNAALYAFYLEALLERHFGLTLTDIEHTQVLTRVVRMLNATVGVGNQ